MSMRGHQSSRSSEVGPKLPSGVWLATAQSIHLPTFAFNVASPSTYASAVTART
ncbi:MAG TPA: hypothetical protein VH560_06865 [Polyangia bacterium]|nr:hypothetical protein [Polyangia bacterium]